MQLRGRYSANDSSYTPPDAIYLVAAGAEVPWRQYGSLLRLKWQVGSRERADHDVHCKPGPLPEIIDDSLGRNSIDAIAGEMWRKSHGIKTI